MTTQPGGKNSVTVGEVLGNLDVQVLGQLSLAAVVQGERAGGSTDA